MPLNLAALQNIRRVQVPDPTVRVKTLADARQMMQNEQLRGLQIQEAQGQLAVQQTSAKKVLAIQNMLEETGGDITDDVVRRAYQIDRASGAALAKFRLDQRNVESEISTRERTRATSEETLAETKRRNTAMELAEQQEREQKGKEPFKVSPGETLLPRTQPLPYTVPGREQAAPRTINTKQGVMQWNPESQRYDTKAGDRPPLAAPLPVIIQTPTGPQAVDRGKLTATPITSGGAVIGPAPTAEMRNKAVHRQNSIRYIGEMKKLSENIITNTTRFGQVVESLKRGGKAALFNDPQYVAYQDSRNSLAASMGTMEQGARISDPDIFKVYVLMVPDIYRDTKESMALKWYLIDRKLNTPEEAQSTAPVEQWERGPDNKLRKVVR